MEYNKNETNESNTNHNNPLASIREHRDAVETLAAEHGRDDNLDAAARILLAVADGKQPADADLAAWGLQPREGYQNSLYAPPGAVTGQPTREDLQRFSQAVLAVAIRPSTVPTTSTGSSPRSQE